jgi:peptide/nickel transport system substrate-binding protein
VVFTFERQVAIAAPNGPSSLLSDMVSVEAEDDSTVVFTLATPDNALWPQILTSPAAAIVDEDVFSADSLTTDDDIVAGDAFSGQYSITSYTLNSLVQLTRNDSYDGLLGAAANESVIVRYYADESNLKLDIQRGEIAVAYRTLNATDTEDLRGEEGLTVHSGPGAEMRFLVFNPETMPYGSATSEADADKALAVRTAVADLIDRDELSDQVYKGTYAPVYSIVPSALTGSTPAYEQAFGDGSGGPSADEAAAALQAAGITGPVDLKLQYNTDHYGSSTSDEYALIKNQLERSGLFTVDLQSTEWTQYVKEKSTSYPLYQQGWFADYPDSDNYLNLLYGTDEAPSILGTAVKDDAYNEVVLRERSLAPATSAPRRSRRRSASRRRRRSPCRSSRARRPSSPPPRSRASTTRSTAPADSASGCSGASDRGALIGRTGRSAAGGEDPRRPLRPVRASGYGSARTRHPGQSARQRRQLRPGAGPGLAQQVRHVELHRVAADAEVVRDPLVRGAERDQVQHLPLARTELGEVEPVGLRRRIEGEADRQGRPPARGRRDRELPVEPAHALGDRAQGVVAGRQLAPAVVADLDEQVEPVAVPLDPHPARLLRLHERQHGAPHDRAGRVRHLAGEGAPGGGRLDELHVEVAEAHERAQVAPEPRERAHDGLQHRAALLVRGGAQLDQGVRGDVDRDGAGRTVVEALGAQGGEHRLQRHRVPVGLLGDRAGVLLQQGAGGGGLGGIHPPNLPVLPASGTAHPIG